MFTPTALALAAALASGAAHAPAGPPVPQAYNGLKPYQVVEQVMAQREVLSLTDEQFARLDDLALAVRTEKHRFTHQGGKPHQTLHVPMISRQDAFEQALTVLTPAQQARFQTFAPVPEAARPAPRRVTLAHGKP
jgi:Spy/CpxP family protein refolding chaperone